MRESKYNKQRYVNIKIAVETALINNVIYNIAIYYIYIYIYIYRERERDRCR